MTLLTSEARGRKLFLWNQRRQRSMRLPGLRSQFPLPTRAIWHQWTPDPAWKPSDIATSHRVKALSLENRWVDFCLKVPEPSWHGLRVTWAICKVIRPWRPFKRVTSSVKTHKDFRREKSDFLYFSLFFSVLCWDLLRTTPPSGEQKWLLMSLVSA